MEIVNIAGYKFVGLSQLHDYRSLLKGRCDELDLKGSILLAPEGINLFLAGERSSVDAFLQFLRNDDRFSQCFSDIEIKESISDHQPFRRIVVRIKKEIITMKHPMIAPGDMRAPAIEPHTLKRWLDQGHDDEGREVVLIDTRNVYEVDIGTFENSLSFPLEHFSDFPDAFLDTAGDTVAQLRDKTLVPFCTGGIRCEKAALFIREHNLPNVFQLHGGILKYFEEVGGAHWSGECFVFDRRVALDSNLQETKNHYEVTAPPARNAAFKKWAERQSSS
ncbi:MAG: sulfurtransferase [Candidatus Obscuribacterales bacterium]|nr:sulfurtransferase [Candidatus Obscuribacterales bacterium]